MYQDVFVYVDQSCQIMMRHGAREMDDERTFFKCIFPAFEGVFLQGIDEFAIGFSSNPFPSMAIQQGSLNGNHLRGDQTMQMHGKFEGLPRKYH